VGNEENPGPAPCLPRHLRDIEGGEPGLPEPGGEDDQRAAAALGAGGGERSQRLLLKLVGDGRGRRRVAFDLVGVKAPNSGAWNCQDLGPTHQRL
jgi:hypothetical protein